MTIRVGVGDGIDVLVVRLIFWWPQLFQQNLCCRLSESCPCCCRFSCLLLSLSLVSVRVSVGLSLSLSLSLWCRWWCWCRSGLLHCHRQWLNEKAPLYWMDGKVLLSEQKQRDWETPTLTLKQWSQRRISNSDVDPICTISVACFSPLLVSLLLSVCVSVFSVGLIRSMRWAKRKRASERK